MAPFGVPPSLGSLSTAQRSELERVSITILHQLLSSLEASLGMSCNTMTWMDWWVGSLFEFEEALPEEKRELFHRVLVSGGRTLNYVARQNSGTYANLLLHRDKLIKDFSPQVSAEEVSYLRNAELPSVPLVFPPGLASSVTVQKRAASQDALVMQALTAKIPRVSSASLVSKGSKAGTSGTSLGAGVSPVVPRRNQGSSSGSCSGSGRGRKKNNKKAAGGGQSFREAPGRSGQVRGAGKGRGRT